MQIFSWNVNSIKARLDHVKQFLAETSPDVLMVQELKGLDFPAHEFEGWETAAVTQKSYNGVAVFSKTPIEVLHESLPGDAEDEQARYIEFETQGIRLINVYAPNGNPVDTEKYTYKLAWMDRLKSRLEELLQNDVPFAIGGDFNVIPEDKDCHDPQKWKGDALFKTETLRKYRAIINLGLTDAYRVFDGAAERYTFWDYQAGAWQKNDGIRIDHFLVSPHLADRLEGCSIDTTPRGWTKPSDHTPIGIKIAA